MNFLYDCIVTAIKAGIGSCLISSILILLFLAILIVAYSLNDKDGLFLLRDSIFGRKYDDRS